MCGLLCATKLEAFGVARVFHRRMSVWELDENVNTEGELRGCGSSCLGEASWCWVPESLQHSSK